MNEFFNLVVSFSFDCVCMKKMILATIKYFVSDIGEVVLNPV